MADALELKAFMLHDEYWQETQKSGLNSPLPKAVGWAASKATEQGAN
jgi:hypothetical protein